MCELNRRDSPDAIKSVGFNFASQNRLRKRAGSLANENLLAYAGGSDLNMQNE